MSKGNSDQKENNNELPLTDEQKKQYILEKLEYVEKDIKNLEKFAAAQFANRVRKEPNIPLNVETEPFKSEFESTITATKNEKNKLGGTNATISLKATLTDFIEDLEKKGIALKDFPEIKEKVDNGYEKEFREKFSTNEKLNNLIKDRVKYEVVNESMPFVKLENGQPIQIDIQDVKNLINSIYENIEISDKLYEDIVKNENNKLKTHLTENIIGPEIKKAFGNPPITLKNSWDEPYEVTTLDNSKLTPENIANFNKSVNDKLKKVSNDQLIAIEKVMGEVKAHNPNLSDTQIKQFENTLSKLDIA